MLAADALVIITPEYNHSIPGGLKNALDWLSRSPLRPLESKPVALQSASPGQLGGARAQEHLRLVMAAVGATVLARPEVIVVQVTGKVDPVSGLLREIRTRAKVSLQLQALTELARAVEKGPASRDDCALGGVRTLIAEVWATHSGRTRIRSPVRKADLIR